MGALSADAAGLISLPEKIGDAFAILIGILLFGALYLWFRPIAAQLQEGAIARAAAERIVGETGCDTLCVLRPARRQALLLLAERTHVPRVPGRQRRRARER